MDALHGGQRHAEGGALRGEQPSAGVALHDRDAHFILLAEPIGPCPLRVDAAQALVVGLREIVVDILRGRQHVEGRVDAEQNHLHDAAFRRQPGHGRVVGAHADVADGPGFLQPPDIFDELSLHDFTELCRLVHEMDHAQVYVVCLQPVQEILEGGLYLGQLPGADILAVLPGGADVALDVPFLPASGDGVADVGAHAGLGHPAVQDIDAGLLAAPDDLLHLLGVMPLQPFSAQADFADHEPCLA